MPEGGVSIDQDTVQVLEGATFMLSDSVGDVHEGSIAGLYHEDTRFLSKFVLTVDGLTPEVLTSDQVDYYSAAFFLTNPKLESVPERTVSIQRHRFVGEGLHDDVILTNHSRAPVALSLRLSLGCDFADLFEVKLKSFKKQGILTRSHDQAHTTLRFEYQHEMFRAATEIGFTQPGRLDGDDGVFDLKLPPRGAWRTCVFVRLSLDDRVMEPLHEGEDFEASEREASAVLEKWRDEVPRLKSGNDLVTHAYDKSIVDLAALRLHAEVEGNDFSLPAAGLPWFMAIFGRDTLITSYQSIWVGPELAKGALQALAALQGKEMNDFKDEEPGKILHEIRFGELTALGLKPHRPYYGTNDATPLWLILLSEYWRFTGDEGTVKELKDTALRALEWIDRYGDRDGDGYVEYETRSSQGLRNQGWKDSWNGVLFADGSSAQTPIALCEIQGYAYDAKLRTAELAEKAWGAPDLAARLRAEAGALFERFNRDYWVDRRGGYYAIGLDGGKRPIDSMTSNMGHLLWSGIVPDDRAKIVAQQLLSTSMFSGWGVRTMSDADDGYNPIAYHDGTVWPHDNSIISAGLVRYGFRDEANRITMAMLEAASFTAYRLPEVFAGYGRPQSRFPIRYPTACSPQAWATGAPFLWLRLMLGIEADDGKLTCRPAVPKEVGRLILHGIHAFGTHYDVAAEGSDGEVTLTS
jgi:glycogen debranching enzyme